MIYIRLGKKFGSTRLEIRSLVLSPDRFCSFRHKYFNTSLSYFVTPSLYQNLDFFSLVCWLLPTFCHKYFYFITALLLHPLRTSNLAFLTYTE